MAVIFSVYYTLHSLVFQKALVVDVSVASISCICQWYYSFNCLLEEKAYKYDYRMAGHDGRVVGTLPTYRHPILVRFHASFYHTFVNAHNVAACILVALSAFSVITINGSSLQSGTY